MRRPSAVALFFLVGLYAASGMLVASGVSDAWGVDDIGIEGEEEFDEQIGDAVDEEDQDGILGTAFEIPVFGAALESLHGMYESVSDTASQIWSAVTIAPDALQSIGVPSYVTSFVLAGLGLIILFDTFTFLTGREW